MKRILLSIFLIFDSALIVAQESFSNLEQNPPSVKWSQIKTPHFRLIFPMSIESLGQRTANVLETVYLPVSQSLGKQPRPISIILQNQTSVSNGFVTLLPRRSEFFTTPPQDPNLLGNNNWLDLLAVHEFRHVVQNDKALTGISKLAYTLFGNNGLGLITSLSTPNWFKEGDAVGLESVLTPSGRGRIPSFDMALRTQLITRGAFSYPKSTGQSFKDFVPNHYVSGYFLTTYVKNKYGNDAWDKILEKMYRFPFYPFSFSNSIKKVTGFRVEEIYSQALADIQKQWKEEQATIQESPLQYLASSAKYFTNYQYPQYLSDGRVLALKSGLDNIESFVILDKQGQEEKLIDLGIFNDAGMLSVQDTKVVWAEFEYDPRWGQRNYSVIKSYDLRYKKIKTLTHKTKYASPALSTDETKIACIESLPENKFAIVILDAQTGRLLQKIPNPDNAFYLHPRWSNTGELVAVQSKDTQKAIVIFEKDTYLPKIVVAPTNENLSHPVKIGEKVFFNSGVTGIDNIFVVNTSTNQRFQVSNRKFGAMNPTLSSDGKELLYNDFTPLGHRVGYVPFDENTLQPFNPQQTQAGRYFGQILVKEAGENLLKSVPNVQYPVKPYSKANVFNIYSWGAVLNSTGNSLIAGVSSQDLLSTTSISAGYGYNANEQRGQLYANLSYQAWYPIIDFSFTSGSRKTSIYIDNDRTLDSLRSDTWNQQQMTLGLRIPLNLTQSKYLQAMSLGANFALTQVSGYNLPKRYLSESYNGTNKSMIYSISYTRQLKQSPRDIAPKWGQGLSFYYRKAFDSNIDGGLATLQGTLLVPGLLPHHSIRLRGGYQYQYGFKDAIGAPNPNLYIFSSPISFARGFSYRNFENLNTFSADYRFPLANPDWGIGRWVYIKRLKTNLFVDMARGETNYDFTVREGNRLVNYKGSDIGKFTSLGIDFSAQFHFMRFSQTFEAGLRFVYLQQNKDFIFQPLVIDIGF